MRALVFERSLPRFAASRLLSELGSGRGAKVAPLRLVDADPPALPDHEWHRVRPTLSGICGSDLATIDGRSSRYFEPMVSFPFVPGHEVVGAVESDASAADGSVLVAGTRVVVQPVLGCVARRIDPPCPSCALGHTGNCERVAFGHLKPGIQTGFCHDTGGGWSNAGLVAHQSQLFRVPDSMTERAAVTVEPLACALHAVLQAPCRGDDVIAVLGAGSLGLLTVAALSHSITLGHVGRPKALLVGARYGKQKTLASELGATSVLAPEQLGRAVRRHSRSMSISTTVGTRTWGGADIVFDCVGSAQTINEALAMVRPRGTVVLVGMPGQVRVDLAPLWHREIHLMGAYAYGTETVGNTQHSTFSLAIEAAAAMDTGRLVSAAYPLDRFEEAIAHAGAAGHRGAIKIVFDLEATSRGGHR